VTFPAEMRTGCSCLLYLKISGIIPLPRMTVRSRFPTVQIGKQLPPKEMHHLL
jgi:hypothetical protein